MKHFAKTLKERAIIAAFVGVAVIAMALGACSTAQTDKFIAGLTNFNRGLAAVDASVQQVNATLYKNCTDFVLVASSINDIAGQCSKASNYTSVANTVILGYCQTSGVSQAGIATSIAVTAKSISAAKSTLSANKVVCSQG